MAEMLPVLEKLSAILRSEYASALDFLLLLKKELKRYNDFTIKQHHLFCYDLFHY